MVRSANFCSQLWTCDVQEVTQFLQRHLEKRPRLAEALLCTQLRVFLQHPVAVQQLLRAVPPNQTSQSLVYSSLCTSLTPGMLLPACGSCLAPESLWNLCSDMYACLR